MVPPPIKAVRNFPSMSTPFLWLASVPDEQVLFPMGRWGWGANFLPCSSTICLELWNLEPQVGYWLPNIRCRIVWIILPHLSRPFWQHHMCKRYVGLWFRLSIGRSGTPGGSCSVLLWVFHLETSPSCRRPGCQVGGWVGSHQSGRRLGVGERADGRRNQDLLVQLRRINLLAAVKRFKCFDNPQSIRAFNWVLTELFYM